MFLVSVSYTSARSSLIAFFFFLVPALRGADSYNSGPISILIISSYGFAIEMEDTFLVRFFLNSFS